MFCFNTSNPFVCYRSVPVMAESGIDLGFDLEFDLNLNLLNDSDSNMDYLPNVTLGGNTENVEFYELKSTRSLRTDEM